MGYWTITEQNGDDVDGERHAWESFVDKGGLNDKELNCALPDVVGTWWWRITATDSYGGAAIHEFSIFTYNTAPEFVTSNPIEIEDKLYGTFVNYENLPDNTFTDTMEMFFLGLLKLLLNKMDMLLMVKDMDGNLLLMNEV